MKMLAIILTLFATAVYGADIILYSTVAPVSAFPAPVAKTGQTNSYAGGDDGDLEKGVAWPVPRFTVQADTNCVLDNLTGLVWARNADLVQLTNWSASVSFCTNLNYGGKTDWRLPNIKEMSSVMCWAFSSPPLCNTMGTAKWSQNDPFVDVVGNYYWSSEIDAANSTSGWGVLLTFGTVGRIGTGGKYGTWPVRGPD